MHLKVQKQIAAKLLKCSTKRIRVDASRLEEIKESITKRDIKGLIKDKALQRKPILGTSRGRARKIQKQKSKGKRKGPGSKKGKKNANLSKKDRWIKKIRAQRTLIKDLRDSKKIATQTYSDLYRKSKGGFFRSRRHIMIYVKDHNLIKNENP